MIEQVDGSGDGEIDFDEFVRRTAKRTARAPRRCGCCWSPLLSFSPPLSSSTKTLACQIPPADLTSDLPPPCLPRCPRLQTTCRW